LETRVAKLEDGTEILFARGRFDDYCVYVREESGGRIPPLDKDYFNSIKEFGLKFGAEKVYVDFVRVFDITGTSVDEQVIELIKEMSRSYGNQQLKFQKTLIVIYAAMIAEENKAFTKLGKRIKRLGVHRILIHNESADYAANFMKGMNWKDIDALCAESGF
jgi:hypothetical protein